MPSKSPEQIIAAIQACAHKLGRAPTREQLKQHKSITSCQVRWAFGDMGSAIRAAGLEPRGSGHLIRAADLLLDWAKLARKLGKLPGSARYAHDGKYTLLPFVRRFRSWPEVPAAFEELAERTGIEAEWKDVLELIRAAGDAKPKGRGRSDKRLSDVRSNNRRLPWRSIVMTKPPSAAYGNSPCHRIPFRDRPVTGPPLDFEGLAHEPVNELGVVFLFGMLAHTLGFRVLSFRAGFPDCEAMREVQPGKWQRVRIEFEYESYNFRRHRHNQDDCDMIVCWRHNWHDCPRNLEVVELCRMLPGRI